MDAPERRSELGHFLKARRASVSAESVGLSRGARRLTPGLRREEVADLAGIGVTWYTWLAQGREINVSRAALDRIARALRFSETDTAYLFSLAEVVAAVDRCMEPAKPAILPQVRVALDMFQGPAFVTDEIFDVVSFNAIADAVFDFDGGVDPFPRNHIWNAFMNPSRRRLYVHSGALHRAIVGGFRVAHGTRGNDARFRALLAALLEGSPDFARLWHEQYTSTLTPRTTHLWHPDFGPLEVVTTLFPVEGMSGHMLVLPTPANAETVAAFARASSTCGRARPKRPSPTE